MTLETLHEPAVERSTPPAGRAGDATPAASDGFTDASSEASLTVTFRHAGSICILSLDGALTAETLGVFECQIDRLGRTPCQRVVIEVGGLTTIDDAGRRVLTGLHHYVQGRGGRLNVTGAAGAISGLLASTPLAAS